MLKWRGNDYPTSIDEIKHILDFQFIDKDKSFLRYLRKPQFEALETYLYLRFVKNTQHIIHLYQEYYPKPDDLLKALNVHLDQSDLVNLLSDGGMKHLFEKVKTDNDFVKKYGLENLRESLTLSYPSYILSLVMGAGKTILVGAIIFIEFALSLKTKKNCFLKNALIFAPGKTIVGSLREISFMDSDVILPADFSNILKSNLKITYTPDGQKNIPVINNSHYNIIITNIEKIRILSKKVERNLINYHKKVREGERENIANLRLQTLASLDNLGVFSDEAHNTYGQDLDRGIKKVRQTIDYLAKNTELKIVVNTTGTPYFKKRILKDVVFWYGLLEGIKENVLKDIRGHIYSYSEVRDEGFIAHVLEDFFNSYKDLPIEGGHRSKIAIYFPKIEDVKVIKPFIEKEVTRYGLEPRSIFEVNSKSSDKDKDIFINRINDKNLPYRIFLLVGMGKEGWNCPSLFACCLARDLGNSNNFVLQASTRCLRQIVGNASPARIYLSQKNTAILDRQLQEHYGENLQSIKKQEKKVIEKKVTLIKYNSKLPPIKIRRKIKKYFKKEDTVKNIKIKKPLPASETSTLIKYDFSKIKKGQLTEKEIIDLKTQNKKYFSLFEVAWQFASLYSTDYFEMFALLETYFPRGDIPKEAFIDIKEQIEGQIDNYSEEIREVEEHLTIVKKEGFDEEINEEGEKIYTTTISVNKEKLEDLLKEKKSYQSIGEMSFHYDPYKFDSKLEVSLFEFILEQIGERRDNVKEFLFTGGMTDRNKTDLVFEYRDKKGRYRNYTPDFLLIRNNGEFIFLETKGKHLEEHFEIKERYFKRYLTDEIKYKLLVSETEHIAMEDKQWVQGEVRG